MTAVSDLIKSARLFAHGDHQRITADRNPALQGIHVHFKSVAQIVSTVCQDEEAIAAAWLHELVEDTAVTLGDLERNFGPGVARLVDEVTVSSFSAGSNRAAFLAVAKDHFAKASPAAKTIKLADLIDTCSDLHKNDRAALRRYAAEAHELAGVLEAGDPGLLARLRRDLARYLSDAPLPEPLPAPTRLETVSVTTTALRVFERAFTARDIAAPLIAFDSAYPTSDILEAMKVAGVDVAGLHSDGRMWGFLDATAPGAEAPDPQRREFAATEIVDSERPLMDVIEVLVRHDRCFVSVDGTVAGVISRIDMHKPAVRMWLFGLITVAELEFTERIRRKWPADSWVDRLSPYRIEKARNLLSEHQRRKEKSQLADCLQLSDKLEILTSDPSEQAAFGIPSASAARRVSRQFESLRNSLAHARDYVGQDWPQVVRLARRIRQMMEE
jgi:HD domain